ncbi:MAG: hypothetical protein PHC64_04975 [Candidatus Gastranaerophilales bacterium]|nr:hypothetical protein [Candidatus Gastranaerophilales bacterium]
MKNVKFLLFIILFCFVNVKVFATQTVFNVPSADVTPKGKVFLMEEVQTTPWNRDEAFYSTTFGAVGLGHNTELSTLLFNVGSPATENISLSVGFKSAIPIPGLKEKFPEREFKLTVGSNILLGLEGNGVGNWTYTHVSGRVPKINTRLTAGVSYGGRQGFGENSFSFIAAVEQPVTKKLSLIGDWYSGSEHWAGFLIVGGSYVLPKNTTLYAGYQIPNGPNVGAAGFVVQLAKIF